MPFVTSIERVAKREGILEGKREGILEGILEGMREGIKALLQVRFAEEGLKLMPEIKEIQDEQVLRAVLQASKTAASPAELRRLWAPEVT